MREFEERGGPRDQPRQVEVEVWMLWALSSLACRAVGGWRHTGTQVRPPKMSQAYMALPRRGEDQQRRPPARPHWLLRVSTLPAKLNPFPGGKIKKAGWGTRGGG